MNQHNTYTIDEKSEWMIPISEGKEIRAVVINGKHSGKTLVVTAGVHGGEYVGIQAVLELIQEINPEELSGRIIFVPLVNEDGFYEGAKQIVPEDSENLNRCFPGNEKGSITFRMANAIEKFLYKEADFLMDLHGGDVNESMAPLVFFPVGAGKKIEEETRRATEFLCIDYRVPSYAKNGLYSYATQCGIPAFLVERGGAGIWSKSEVNACKKNVYEMMDYLGIRPTEKTKNPPIEIEQACYEEAEEKGFWYCEKKAGERIKKGEILGKLVDDKGEFIKQYEAQFDGVVLYFTHALGVKKGDPLIAYGKI